MELTKFDQAYQALQEARTIDDFKNISDRMASVQFHLKRRGESLEMINIVAEIKLRAEKELGYLLKEMPKQNGARPSDFAGFPDVTPPTLSDIGITKKQSSRYQSVAKVPDALFEIIIAETKAKEEELTTKQLLARAKQEQARQQSPQPAITPTLPKGKYRCIVIDPPWPMKKIEREERPNQGIELDYPTMSLEEIEALPVQQLADESGCHLYLWVTQKYLPDGLHLAKIWGFNYQCLMTWRKNVGITPYSWMYDTEHVIFARMGNLPLQKLGLRLSFDAPVNGHSVKPDIFFNERVIPASLEPRLEMFARREREGFEVWGNEVAS